MWVLPVATMSRRSRPRATPVASGTPAPNAARNASSRGNRSNPLAERSCRSASKRLRCSLESVSSWNLLASSIPQVEPETFRLRLPPNPGQGRLARGIIVDEDQPVPVERWFDTMGEQQIEPAVVVEIQTLDSGEIIGGLPQHRCIRAHGVQSQVAPKQVPVADAPDHKLGTIQEWRTSSATSVIRAP